MSEIGIIPTKSLSSESVGMLLGGDNCQIKIKDDVLWVKAKTSMLGYLNHPYEFDNGWFCTGDKVSVNEDGTIRFLGRDSDIINIGGQKVYPHEIEEVLLKHPEVLDCVVYSRKSAFLGQMVCADVVLKNKEEKTKDLDKMFKHCLPLLPHWKVPSVFTFVDSIEMTSRGKKERKNE
jgi:acyl-CoA synthetase (AMP-forming)/AMP-acid ligase II